MKNVTPSKGPVVHKKNRRQHVGRTDTWSDAESRALELLLEDPAVDRGGAADPTSYGGSERGIRQKIYSLLEAAKPKEQTRYVSQLTPGSPARKSGGADPSSPVAMMLTAVTGPPTAHRYYHDGPGARTQADSAHRVMPRGAQQPNSDDREWPRSCSLPAATAVSREQGLAHYGE